MVSETLSGLSLREIFGAFLPLASVTLMPLTFLASAGLGSARVTGVFLDDGSLLWESLLASLVASVSESPPHALRASIAAADIATAVVRRVALGTINLNGSGTRSRSP